MIGALSNTWDDKTPLPPWKFPPQLRLSCLWIVICLMIICHKCQTYYTPTHHYSFITLTALSTDEVRIGRTLPREKIWVLIIQNNFFLAKWQSDQGSDAFMVFANSAFHIKDVILKLQSNILPWAPRKVDEKCGWNNQTEKDLKKKPAEKLNLPKHR